VVHVLSAKPSGTFRFAYDLDAGGIVSGLALSRDGRDLWVAEPESNRVVRLDPRGERGSRAFAVNSPDQLVLSPDERTLYATNWRGRTVVTIATGSGRKHRLKVGQHPTAIAFARRRLLVANSNDATVTSFEPGSRHGQKVDLAQVGRRSDSPNAIATARNGRTAYVSLGGDNAVAVLKLTKTGSKKYAWRTAGLIPTGWYPTAVALSPDDATLHVVTARGLARSAGATKPYSALDPASYAPDGAYATVGTLETLPVPHGEALAKHTAQVRANLADNTPPGLPSTNPLVAGRNGPIKHVIYVTRENKTYDAVLGDLHPGPGNELTVFGESITPNVHALERGFVESQNFAYQGFASVVGHMWEDAAGVSERFERGIGSATGTHSRHVNSSWRDPQNYPLGGTIADQAFRGGRSVRTYNMETAQQAKRIPKQFQADTSVFPNYNLHIPDSQREAGWESEFQQFESHHCTGALAATYGADCSLPAFEYVYLGGDHTTVTDQPGFPTLEAQVADNDYATGRLIDVVSHSSYWNSTLVIVVEDDPQGTGDHLSAYHGLMAVASPWLKRGYISTAPYNLASPIAAIDRILGLPPLTDYAATSRPLDDVFADSPDYTPFAADASGVAAHPFVPLPGRRPKSDPKHGIYSFTRPDATDPRVSGRATWREMKGRRTPARVSAP
jgi:DNA-binding beta-propeller fold protein YncE